MAQEQFVDRGLTVANAVGDKAVGVAVRVSEFARDDTSKIMAVVGVVLVVLGMRAMSQNPLRRRNLENKIEDQNRKKNEAKN